jgi:hypothetical protein
MSIKEQLKKLPKPDMRYCTPQWAEREAQIRKFVENDYVDRFLQWSPCRRSLSKPNADLELGYLHSLPDWSSRWRHAVQESRVGKMVRYPKYLPSSGILLRHAAIIAWFEQVTGLDITASKSVLEFGGGYGSMCRLIHRLGWDGQYVIYDLPVLTLLQQYYLSENDIAGVESTFDFDGLVEYVAEFKSPSVFIATWSLSEAPFSIRNALLPLVMEFDWVILASQHQIRDMDNVAYFEDWERTMSDFTWHWKNVRKVAWIAASRN